MGFGQNVGWEMGFVFPPPPPPSFTTLYCGYFCYYCYCCIVGLYKNKNILIVIYNYRT